MRVGVDHARDDDCGGVFDCAGWGVNCASDRLDHPVLQEDLTVTDHAVRDRVDLVCTDQDGRRLSLRCGGTRDHRGQDDEEGG